MGLRLGVMTREEKAAFEIEGEEGVVVKVGLGLVRGCFGVGLGLVWPLESWEGSCVRAPGSSFPGADSLLTPSQRHRLNTPAAPRGFQLDFKAREPAGENLARNLTLSLTLALTLT